MRKYVGMMIIALVGVTVSLQVYGLSFLQLLDTLTGSWMPNDVLWYAGRGTVPFAFIIDAGLLLYGIILVTYKK